MWRFFPSVHADETYGLKYEIKFRDKRWARSVGRQSTSKEKLCYARCSRLQCALSLYTTLLQCVSSESHRRLSKMDAQVGRTWWWMQNNNRMHREFYWTFFSPPVGDDDDDRRVGGGGHAAVVLPRLETSKVLLPCRVVSCAYIHRYYIHVCIYIICDLTSDNRENTPSSERIYTFPLYTHTH